MAKPIKALFFDWGSTLAKEDNLYHELIAKTIEINHLSLSEEEFFSYLIEGASKHENPYRYTLKKLGIPLRVEWDFTNEELYLGVIPLLEHLSKRYRLGLIANQPVGFLPRLQKFHLEPYFSFIYGSDDIGLAKPDPRLFQKGLDELGLSGEEVLMVGDRLENDILPAKKVGIGTCWVKQGLAIYENPLGSFDTPDYEIKGILELESLLKLIDH